MLSVGRGIGVIATLAVSVCLLGHSEQNAPNTPPGPAFAQASAQVPATGSISGRVTDTAKGSIPGVKVTAAGGGVYVWVMTDAQGRYVVKDRPEGAYVITAELTGFRPERREEVMVVAGRDVVVDLMMTVSPPHEPLWLGPQEIGDAWQEADAVLHIRIQDSLGVRRWTTLAVTDIVGYQGVLGNEYTATVVTVVKHHPGAGHSVRFLQTPLGERLYERDEEYIAFLKWSPEADAFIRLAGPRWFLPIRGGRVLSRHRASGPEAGWMIDDFVGELKALAQRDRKRW